MGTAQTRSSHAKPAANRQHGTGSQTRRPGVATHRLEAGVDVRPSRRLLGHQAIDTTPRSLQSTRQPLGTLHRPCDLRHGHDTPPITAEERPAPRDLGLPPGARERRPRHPALGRGCQLPPRWRRVPCRPARAPGPSERHARSGGLSSRAARRARRLAGMPPSPLPHVSDAHQRPVGGSPHSGPAARPLCAHRWHAAARPPPPGLGHQAARAHPGGAGCQAAFPPLWAAAPRRAERLDDGATPLGPDPGRAWPSPRRSPGRGVVQRRRALAQRRSPRPLPRAGLEPGRARHVPRRAPSGLPQRDRPLPGPNRRRGHAPGLGAARCAPRCPRLGRGHHAARRRPCTGPGIRRALSPPPRRRARRAGPLDVPSPSPGCSGPVDDARCPRMPPALALARVARRLPAHPSRGLPGHSRPRPRPAPLPSTA